MQAHEEAFSFIKKEYFYDVPFFQRNYVWSYENWDELLTSLLDQNKCSFLGSIILKQVPTPSGATGRFSIIDGQQRLTTLSILMRACYDTLMNNKDKYPEKAINGFEAALDAQLFVTTDTFTGEKEVKIKHSHIDRPSFEGVINGDYAPSEALKTIVLRDEAAENPKDLKETVDRILLCYKYFIVQLEHQPLEKVQKLWNTLIKDDVKFLVNIDLLVEENEQTIFDAVNSSGVRLTCSDTIKNAVFQRYIDILKGETSIAKAEQMAIKLYEKYWVSAFLANSEDAQYWATQHQSGRLLRENIEILLHCVAVIEKFFDPASMKMSELSQCYKDHIAKMSAEELSAFIVRIHDYAILYRERIVTNEISVQYSYADYFMRLIHILDTLEISTFHPYLLNLLYQKKIGMGEDAFRENCASLERYVILHAICNASTKNYNKECIQLLNGESLDEMLENCDDINQERFNAGLRNVSSNKNAMLLLFWIELYRRSLEKVDQKELKYTYTLEHIMPQKWNEYWDIGALPVKDHNGNIVDEEENAIQIRSAAVYEIGNMTLLNSKLNTSLRNYTFDRKKAGEGKKRGMKDLADCMITRELLDTQIWDEAAIHARTERLSAAIKKVWNISFDTKTASV